MWASVGNHLPCQHICSREPGHDGRDTRGVCKHEWQSITLSLGITVHWHSGEESPKASRQSAPLLLLARRHHDPNSRLTLENTLWDSNNKRGKFMLKLEFPYQLIQSAFFKMKIECHLSTIHNLNGVENVWVAFCSDLRHTVFSKDAPEMCEYKFMHSLLRVHFRLELLKRAREFPTWQTSGLTCLDPFFAVCVIREVR